MPPKSLVVVRTHFVDQRLLHLIEAIDAAPEYQVVVAVDEMRRPVDTKGFAKLSMTAAAFDELGLYTEIDDLLWRCGDYPLYLARRAFPDFAGYWLIEYDVAINRADPVSFFREFDGTHAHDFLSTHFREREPGWNWGDPMQSEYPVVWRSYFPLVRLSGRAIDFLLERRVLASSKIMAIAPQNRPFWANDESFTACELHYNGFECADFKTLSDCYDDSTFFNDVLFDPDHLPPHDGKIYHMVRSGIHYLKAVRPGLNKFQRPTLRDLLDLTGKGLALEEVLPVLQDKIVFMLGFGGDLPENILSPTGPILTLFEHEVLAPVLQMVVLALARLRMRFTIDALTRIAVERGWPMVEAFSNLALARPAWQSSIGLWSKHQNYRLDAEGGNDGNRHVDFGFHTASEYHPSWTVDLQHRTLLTEVRSYNRIVHPERLGGFRLLASLDGQTWHAAHQSPIEIDPTLTPEEPIRIALATEARLLRVQSLQDGFFHFREFEAYGTQVQGR